MAKRGKLELTWVGKEDRPHLEPRILVEDPTKSYGDPGAENMLIFGNNLLALKALERDFAGKIKCIYIDPPYNTGQAFANYDDGVEHSLWLSLMRDRLELLRKLLTDDGAIFVQLNDEEQAYCKVLLDEVFGRRNFINQIAVKTKNIAGASGGGEDKRLKKNIEFVLVYVKDNDSDTGFRKFNEVFEETNLFELIEDMRLQGKSWKYTSILLDKGQFIEERTVRDGSGDSIRVRKYKGIKRATVRGMVRCGLEEEAVYVNHFHAIFSDTNAQTSIRTRIIDEFKTLADDEVLAAEYTPRSGRDKGKIVEHLYISPTIRRVIWLKDTTHKRGRQLIKLDKLGTFWSGYNWNNVSKEGDVIFPSGKKPEALIKTIVELSTKPGDWVLDSFAGSGTTGAVAHKMGRRWIMVEMGEHCHTHIVPRLQRAIDGKDQGGISEIANWQGGGGFKYYRLAESLLVQDKDLSTKDAPVYVINPRYDETMLVQAICKIENFNCRNDGRLHGISSESRFLHVTTNLVTQAYIDSLVEDISLDQSLLVYCTRRRRNLDLPENVEIKNIPRDLLNKCDFNEAT